MPEKIIDPSWKQETHGSWTIMNMIDSRNNQIKFLAAATREESITELIETIQSIHQQNFDGTVSEIRLNITQGPRDICQFVSGRVQ